MNVNITKHEIRITNYPKLIDIEAQTLNCIDALYLFESSLFISV